MSCESFFIEQLQKKGFRLTPQREIVLSILHQMDSLASVEDIFAKVQTVSNAVDISTVYRTLDLLQDFNLVISIDLGENHRVFKLVGVEEPHLHLVCVRCDAVIGVDIHPAESFAATLMEKNGFQADLTRLNIPGLCENCRGQKTRSITVNKLNHPTPLG
jgi:Fur family ferric uptake transcriptional regulator